MRMPQGPSPAPTNTWSVPAGLCTKSQARSRSSSPSISTRHSPKSTRKSSWAFSRWYRQFGWPGSSTWMLIPSCSNRFEQLGINIQVLEPGQPNCLYHRENAQEDFLVLFGECLVLIEGEELRLRAWDFVHSPAGTDHVFVGAGDGPCGILMVGFRPETEELFYPAAEVAGR